MKNYTKKIFSIFIVVFVLGISALLLAYRIHENFEKEITNFLIDRQLIIAEITGKRIEDFFKGLEMELQRASFEPSIRLGDCRDCEIQLELSYNEIENKIISLRRLDKRGILTSIFSKENRNELIGTDYSSQPYFVKCLNTGMPYVSNELTHETGEKEIHLAVPVFTEGSKEFNGIITCDVSLSQITENFISSKISGKDRAAWIMDSAGTLLIHTKHSEMVSKNIFSSSEECLNCHSSFEPLKKVLKSGRGVQKYSVKGSDEVLVCAVPINLSANRWIMAVNIPVAELHMISGNRFLQSVILMAIIGILVLLGVFISMKIYKEAMLSEKTKKYSEELLKTKTLLESVIESSVDGIFVTDEKGMITEANNSAQNILGYSREELISMRSSQLSIREKEIIEKRRSEVEKLFREGKLDTYETQWKKKNGEVFPVECTNSLFKGEGGDYAGGTIIFRDITERKKLQEELLRTQRIAAINQIGITVKHEINSPLGGIVGYSELILKHPEGLSEKNLKRINEIHNMSLRIREIISKIKNLNTDETVDYIEGLKMINIADSENKEPKK